MHNVTTMRPRFPVDLPPTLSTNVCQQPAINQPLDTEPLYARWQGEMEKRASSKQRSGTGTGSDRRVNSRALGGNVRNDEMGSRNHNQRSFGGGGSWRNTGGAKDGGGGHNDRFNSVMRGGGMDNKESRRGSNSRWNQGGGSSGGDYTNDRRNSNRWAQGGNRKGSGGGYRDDGNRWRDNHDAETFDSDQGGSAFSSNSLMPPGGLGLESMAAAASKFQMEMEATRNALNGEKDISTGLDQLMISGPGAGGLEDDPLGGALEDDRDQPPEEEVVPFSEPTDSSVLESASVEQRFKDTPQLSQPQRGVAVQQQHQGWASSWATSTTSTTSIGQQAPTSQWTVPSRGEDIVGDLQQQIPQLQHQLQQRQPPTQPSQQVPRMPVPPVIADEWFYQDPHGNVQGPFKSEEMREWLEHGYFNLDLMVRRGRDGGPFTPLGQRFPDPRNAFSLEHEREQQMLLMRRQMMLQQQRQQQQSMGVPPGGSQPSQFWQGGNPLLSQQQQQQQRLQEQQRLIMLQEQQQREEELRQKRAAEEEQARILKEKAAWEKREREEEQKRQAEMMEQQRRKQQEEEHRRRLEEENQRRLVEEEHRRVAAEGERRRLLEEEKQRALKEEEEKRWKIVKEEEMRRKKVAEHQKREIARAKAKEEEEERQRALQAEAERRKAEEKPVWGDAAKKTVPQRQLTLKEIQEMEEHQAQLHRAQNAGAIGVSMAARIAQAAGISTGRLPASAPTAQPKKIIKPEAKGVEAAPVERSKPVDAYGSTLDDMSVDLRAMLGVSGSGHVKKKSQDKPAWTNAARPSGGKSLKEIQEEEARQLAAKREHQQKIAKQQQQAASSSGVWASKTAVKEDDSLWEMNTSQDKGTWQKPKDGRTTVQSSHNAQPAMMASSTSSSSGSNDFGGKKMSPDMRKWCEGQVAKLGANMTLVEFCYALDDASDIREYLRDYLGSTPQVSAFASEFIQRKKGGKHSFSADDGGDKFIPATSKKKKKKKQPM